jgi:hypothetical protein
MAVANIDTVYQRVLALANKEQRGYITPQEFNLLAGKAQNDIFEMYFHDYKTALLSPGNQSKTADDLDILREKIAMHRVVGATLTGSNKTLSGDVHWLENIYKSEKKSRVVTFNAPAEGHINDTSVWGSISKLKLRAYYDGYGDSSIGEGEYIIYFLRNGSTHEASSNSYQIVIAPDDGASKSTVAGVVAKAINEGSPYHSATRDGEDVIITYLQDRDFEVDETSELFLAGGGVSINVTSVSDYATFEEVSKDDWNYIRSSKKLNPNKNSRGIFYRSSASGVQVLPYDGSTTILYDYIKRPTNPQWGFTLLNGKALYNSGTTIPFGLHSSEESTLTNKILELAGIVLNKPGLSEVILRNEAVKEANENK